MGDRLPRSLISAYRRPQSAHCRTPQRAGAYITTRAFVTNAGAPALPLPSHEAAEAAPSPVQQLLQTLTGHPDENVKPACPQAMWMFFQPARRVTTMDDPVAVGQTRRFRRYREATPELRRGPKERQADHPTRHTGSCSQVQQGPSCKLCLALNLVTVPAGTEVVIMD